MTLTRRGLIVGTASLLAAPALVRAQALMPVSARHVPVLVDLSGVARETWWGDRVVARKSCWVMPDLLRPDSTLMLDAKGLLYWAMLGLRLVEHGYERIERTNPDYADLCSRVGALRLIITPR